MWTGITRMIPLFHGFELSYSGTMRASFSTAAIIYELVVNTNSLSVDARQSMQSFDYSLNLSANG